MLVCAEKRNGDRYYAIEFNRYDGINLTAKRMDSPTAEMPLAQC